MAILFIIFLQAMWFFQAYFDAREEAAWSFPFRAFNWPASWEEQKKARSDEAHFLGACAVITICLMSSVLFGCIVHLLHKKWWFTLLSFVLSGTSALAIYWKYFDMRYSVSIGKDKFYIGATAALDKWLVKKFGLDKAGKKKALFCTIWVLMVDLTIVSIELLKI